MNAHHFIILLLIVSILLAVISSFTTLALLDKAKPCQERRKRTVFVLLSGFSLGIGVWLVYTIGIVAAVLPQLVFFSFLPAMGAILSASVGFAICLSFLKRQKPSIFRSLFISIGIAGSMKAAHAIALRPMCSWTPLSLPERTLRPLSPYRVCASWRYGFIQNTIQSACQAEFYGSCYAPF